MAIVRRGEEQEGTRGIVRRREWDPFELMRDMFLRDPLDEIRRALSAPETGYLPHFDVKETRDAYIFKADLPGIRDEDLDVTVTGNRLTVSGRREQEKREEDERYYAYERSYGTFSRSFTLPEGADTTGVDAELRNGELTIRLGKKPDVHTKKIPLRKGSETGKARA